MFWIGNTPVSNAYWVEEDGELVVRALICDETIFGRKIRLYREYRVSTKENAFLINDTIENTDEKILPFEILYHMNMGYPLLDEDSIVEVPAESVIPRDEHSAEDLDNCLKMIRPEHGYKERCYYHKFVDANGKASIYQPKLGVGLEITFNTDELDAFVEWKMIGIRDYALGLECGNCYPDGRDVMRKTGMLKFLQAGEKKTYQVKIRMI